MSRTVLQLRVGATRDRGFLFRTCVRPPATITIGRARDAVLPIDDPSGPDIHPLFSIGSEGCLLDCRSEWDLVMYRDEGTVTGDQLLAEGTAMRSGRRILMRVAPGSRGALTFGSIRMLFKWEVVPEEEIGEVPLRDVGDVPRCHACGLVLRDALPREPLLARCDACRALNRFVDPDAPYRQVTAQLGALRPSEDAESSQKMPTVSEEKDTLLAVPIFAPLTTHNVKVLPQYAQPAGRPGRDETPRAIRVAKNPVHAVEQMQTVLSKSPFVKRPPIGASDRPAEELPPPAVVDRIDGLDPDASLEEPEEVGDASGWHEVEMSKRASKDRPKHRTPELAELHTLHPEEDDGPLDELFYTAEVEALGLEAPSTLDPDIVGEGPVAWGTMSVLSAKSRYETGDGRIPRGEVRRAVHDADVDETDWFTDNAPLISALAGIALLALGVVMVISGESDDAPPPVSEAAVPASAAAASPDRAQRLVPERDSVAHPTATYVKFLPGDPTPISVRVPGFSIDRTEVTTSDFERFLAATGARPPQAWLDDRPEQSSSRPATGVTLDEARSYCRWTGGRLPAEMEWERAAAGTYGRMYPWGNSFSPEVVASGPRPEPVGTFPEGASESGVLDLIGNAVEWVEPGDGEEGFLKGGGAGAWSARPHLMVFARIAPDAAAWKPGPGFRCAYD